MGVRTEGYKVYSEAGMKKSVVSKNEKQSVRMSWESQENPGAFFDLSPLPSLGHVGDMQRNVTSFIMELNKEIWRMPQELQA